MTRPREIERKFLVPELPPGLERWPATRIEQGYLAIGSARNLLDL